ncbi:MAG: hypothetical protein ACQESG_05845 [Nanobdellota archaeon]
MREVTIDGTTAVLSINPAIYPLDIIYSAAYVLLDEAHILLDGDPKKEVSVRIKPKQDQDPTDLGNKFYDQLINYGVYKEQVRKNQDLRKIMLQRVLLTNGYTGDEELIPWEDHEDDDTD